MPFISVAEELTKKSVTTLENKFITKYLPELDPLSVKVYLYALYLVQNGQQNYTIDDFANKLHVDTDKLQECFTYLDEFELVRITSLVPFEITILDCENFYGKPKKLHPEKYGGLYEEIQTIISGREVSQNEFMDYLILLEEYGLERNALIMLINYCTNLKGVDIGPAYIKKVCKNFCSDGVTTAGLVDERLSKYNASTASLIKIFNACSIKRRPEVEDGRLLQKWYEMGFSDDAVICAAKGFKIKKLERLDDVMQELYKYKKFDVKEIDGYRKTKDSLYEIALAAAKSLGIFVSDLSPYVENYVSVWVGYGFSATSLKQIADYCFLSGRNSFDAMGDFVASLYKDAYVDDGSVETVLSALAEDDKLLKTILSACGLSRKIIPYDRQALSRWREWGFNENMIMKAAALSAGKNNPVAAMNYLLSTWKNASIYTVEQIPANDKTDSKKNYKAAQKERDTQVYMSLFNKLTGEEDAD